MKGHLTKNLEHYQFQMISISGTWSMLPSVQVRLCTVFPFLFFYFLIFFIHIRYPACRHITCFFLSPYPFPELFDTVHRWLFFFHSLVFLYFSIEIFGVRLEDLILPVEFITFIKSCFPLCFYLYFFCFSSSLILGISVALVILYFLKTFLAFLLFGSLFHSMLYL